MIKENKVNQTCAKCVYRGEIWCKRCWELGNEYIGYEESSWSGKTDRGIIRGMEETLFG